MILLAALLAQQVAPDLGYVYPPVVPPGTSKVVLGGYDLTPDIEIRPLDPAVKIEKLGPPGEFIITPPPYWFGPKASEASPPIPRELPAKITAPSPGIVPWQIFNVNGVSSPAFFLVDAGPIVLEARRGDAPQALDSIPVTVAGRLSRIAEVDRYSFTAPADGPVSVELFAQRIGSKFHGVMVIDGVGDLVATEGHDGALTFAAVKDRSYLLKLHDVEFCGDPAFVYALRLRTGPRVLVTRPISGRRGESREVAIIGYGLEAGKTLERVTRTVAFPRTPESAFDYTLETPFGAVTVPLRLDEVDEIVDGTELSERVAANGTIGAVGEEDRYTLDAGKGERWAISVETPGSPVDPVVRVLDPGGRDLGETREFEAKADGKYTIVVGDLSTRVGTPDSTYRVRVTPARPDFALTIPQNAVLTPGDKTTFEVKLARSGGFTGEVSIAVLGLPAGVTAPPDLKIPKDKDKVGIALSATPEFVAPSTLIRVVGAGDGARVATENGGAPHLLLVRTLKPPLSIDVVGRERQRELPRGSTYPAQIEIEREAGFSGPIKLMMASKQGYHRQGMRGPIVEVPAGAALATYPVFLPEWLQTDRTSRMEIVAMAEVAGRHVMVKTTSRLTMILEGALVKVAVPAGGIEAPPGEPIEIPVDVRRRPNFTEPVTLELVGPAPFKAEPVVVPGEATRAILRVEATGAAGDEVQLTVRGTALQDGKWPAISEAAVTVYLEKVR